MYMSNPQVIYKKKTSTTYAPGGTVSESKSREYDAVLGTDTLGLRRTYNQSYVESLKTKDLRTGEVRVTRNRSEHMVVEDDDAFDDDWSREAQRLMPRYMNRAIL
eukprot:PhF_6_TR4944/c0_g1_i2/m.7009